MADQVGRLASVYAENGRWKPALSLQLKIVEYRKQNLGKIDKDTLRAQRNVSEIYWNLFEIKSAIDIQRQLLYANWWSRPSLGDWLRPLKPDHVNYCIALDGLTRSLWLAGLKDLSKRTGERAVDGFLKQLGPEDPLTLNAMFNLGRTYHHMSEFEKSHDLLVLVLRKRKMLFGPNHPDTLMVRNELGMSLCARKKHLAVAERLVTSVLETRKRILGEEHAYTLWSINDLTRILNERGHPEKSVQLLEDLIPVVERTLGHRHVGMNMTKGNLA
jgi:tetratricopeptide (TPR) repeat protein